jgi:cytochrome c553
MKVFYRSVLLALSLWLCTVPAFSATADELLHKYTFCLVCHGYQGQGNAIVSAPALAGIEPWYLNAALDSYRAANRHTTATAMEMQTAARMIEPVDYAEAQAFLELLKPGLQSKAAATSGQVQRGAMAYAQYCAACHGSNAEGNELLAAPGLKRLNGWYLAATWQAYLAGSRGDDNASLAARQMRQFALSLPAEVAMDDLIAFITE